MRARMRARSGRLAGSSVQGRKVGSDVVATDIAVFSFLRSQAGHLQAPYASTCANKPNPIDQGPSATNRSPVHKGRRLESPASRSSARRAGAHNTATTSGRESERPKSDREMKPEIGRAHV